MEIRDCMKRNVFSIASTATIRQAAALITEHHIGLLPVVDEQGKPIGVVRLADLLSLELPDFLTFYRMWISSMISARSKPLVQRPNRWIAPLPP